jgi:branched-chain amino acid transport system ATP-binding protein
MLQVDAINAYYDQNQVLFGTSIAVGQGEVVALMGRNGMGKTTTVNNVIGLIRPRSGAWHCRGTRRASNLSDSHGSRKLGSSRSQPR